ncbi:MAG: hypothetical protein M3033_11820 [Acidobacteriota bacterium]|nr:hypothetical protein [Acidobacteriota bacterium]
MAKILYDFEFNFQVTDGEETGYTEVVGDSTEVEDFSVIGGLAGILSRDGRGDTDDARIMAEFYQARQFHNLQIKKPLNRVTLNIDRIYYRKLSFQFSFAVSSLSPNSKFKGLELEAKDAQITVPPNRNSNFEVLIITFSEPKIHYWTHTKEGNLITEWDL